MVLVETATSPAPSPGTAYELAPEGEVTLQEEQGLRPSVISLSEPEGVSSGGVRGSEDRSEVIVPGAGDIELDEVVYTKGDTAWIAMVGCTVACYNTNAVTLSSVIGSVKVAPAAVYFASKGEVPARRPQRPTLTASWPSPRSWPSHGTSSGFASRPRWARRPGPEKVPGWGPHEPPARRCLLAIAALALIVRSFLFLTARRTALRLALMAGTVLCQADWALVEDLGLLGGVRH
jgi:hypothetical protein